MKDHGRRRNEAYRRKDRGQNRGGKIMVVWAWQAAIGGLTKPGGEATLRKSEILRFAEMPGGGKI